MARVAWILEDLTTSETYSWEINPKDITMPRRKAITYASAAAPGGRVVAYEGRDEVRKFSYSGTILTEAQLLNLEEWFEKRHLLKLTDDLGREYGVYITSFELQRSFHSAQFPWRHNYSGEMLLVDWTGIGGGGTLHTYNVVSVDAPISPLLTGFESGNGLDPGSIVDLVDLNSGSSNLTGASDGVGWELDDFGPYNIGMFGANFGPVTNPGTVSGVWSLVVTFLPRGSGAPVLNKNTFIPLLLNLGIGEMCFTAAISPNDGSWTEDGETVEADNTVSLGNLKMETLLDELGGDDLICWVVVQVGDPLNPGTSIPEYYPIIDSIQLKATT